MIKHLENNNFDEEIKNKDILVDFYAEWCGPCKMMGAVLEELNDVEILKVNTDEYPQIAQRYGIMSIPTLIYFKNGEEFKKSIGFKTKKEIMDFINE